MTKLTQSEEHDNHPSLPSEVDPLAVSETSERPWFYQLLGRSVELAITSLPEITAPSLEGLSVTVPPPQPVTEETLQQRLTSLQMSHAHLTPRRTDEFVQPGDLVTLDVIGFANQQLIPFITQEGLRIHLKTQDPSSEFWRGLVGLPVGQSSVIHATLPESFPFPSFQGAEGAFAVEVVEAHHMEPFDFKDPESLQRLDMGDSIDAVLSNILVQIEEEMTESLLRHAARLVMESLSDRVTVSIPPRLIDEEIRQHWLNREGLFLQNSDMDADDMEASMISWLQHKELREEATRRLTFAVLIRAISEQLAPPIEEHELDEFLDGLAEELGLPAEEARASLQEESDTFQQLIDKFVYIRTLEFVISQAHIEFAE